MKYILNCRVAFNWKWEIGSCAAFVAAVAAAAVVVSAAAAAAAKAS